MFHCAFHTDRPSNAATPNESFFPSTISAMYSEVAIRKAMNKTGFRVSLLAVHVPIVGSSTVSVPQFPHQ